MDPEAVACGCVVSLEGPLAMGMPATFPQLSVIHDLNLSTTQIGAPSMGTVLQPLVSAFARRANVGDRERMLEADLADTHGINRDRVVVIPNAADERSPRWHPKQSGCVPEVRGGSAYFVYVGSLHPRKTSVVCCAV